MRNLACMAAVLVAFGCDPEAPADTGVGDTGVDAADTTEDAGPVRWHLHGRDSRVRHNHRDVRRVLGQHALRGADRVL